MTNRIEVTVPDIGEFTGVPVIELLVAPGDRVEVEDPLLTLESDKATMDVPAPAAGVVAELLVALGEEVSQGDALVVLEALEEAPEGAPGASRAPPSPAAGDAPPTSGPPSPDEASAIPEARGATDRETPAGRAPGDPRAPGTLRRPPPAAGLPSLPGRRTGAFHATPSVRRFARELGVSLAGVAGTGRKGRILEEDVRRHVKERLAAPAPADRAAPAARAGEATAPPAPILAAPPPLPVIDFSRFGETETMPLGRIKRRTAANLRRAWLEIPLVTHFDETDVTDLDEFRRSLRGDPDARGARITLLAFAMKALVAALRVFPTFNASLSPDGESLILKRYFHVGIAVDTPEGLVVPVVRSVDRKRVSDLSLELADLGERARERKLRPDDVRGSCMTISSLGGIGGTAFAPLVNPPEVAILGLARTRVAPRWNGREFEPRTVLPISLSYDHRVIDGAEAARFCRRLCLLLGDVRRLLL